MKELTDGAEPISEEFEAGVRSVVYIRCMEHRMVPVYNQNESTGAECAACTVITLQKELASARGIIRVYANIGNWNKDRDIYCRCSYGPDYAQHWLDAHAQEADTENQQPTPH